MKFYVIEVAEGDSKVAGKGIYEYGTLKEAEASFHKRLGTAMSSDLYDSDLVMVINSEGGTYLNLIKKYNAVEPEPSPLEV